MARTQLKESPKRVFAHLNVEGRVHELIREQIDITLEWHPNFLYEQCVEITDQPEVEVGWVKAEDGSLRPPEEPVPTDAQRRRVAFNSGARVTSKRAVFPTSTDAWPRMIEVATHVRLFDEFPGGQKQLDWPSDPPTKFRNADEFLGVFKALSSWREAWNQFVDGRGDAPGDEVDA